jgi:hypothetical protein
MVDSVTWTNGLIRGFDFALMMQGAGGYSSYTFNPLNLGAVFIT